MNKMEVAASGGPRGVKTALFELFTIITLLSLGAGLLSAGLPGTGLITVAVLLALFSGVMRMVPRSAPVVTVAAEQS